MGGHCDVVEAADKGAIWSAVHLGSGFGGWWDGWIGAAKLEPGDHGGITWVGIGLSEVFNDVVNEGSLGERYCHGRSP
jgi:hypothetical protein